MKNLIFLIVTFFFFSQYTYSQAGELDSTFGKNGIVKANLGTIFQYTSTPRQVLNTPDGALYTVREQDGQTYVTKRIKNGNIDDNYGTEGVSRAINLTEAHALLQPDGKIVIVGYNNPNNRKDFVIGRFTTRGGLDGSFSGDGLQTTKFASSAFATAVALQSDGKIVVAGFTNTVDNNSESTSDFALARYNSDGSLDTSFSNDGRLITENVSTDDVPSAIAIQSDGKIVVAGTSTDNSQNNNSSYGAIIRYNQDGSTDISFSIDTEKFGYLFASPNAVTIQDDGKIVIVGQSVTTTGPDNETTSTDIFITRYNATGSLDTTFNNTGWQTVDFGYSNENAFAVSIYSSGKIGVGCNIYNGNNSDFALVRFNANGGLDSSFSNNGLQRIDFDLGEDVASLFAILDEGKIIMAGRTNYYNLGIAHFNYDGSPDTSFNGDGKLTVEFEINDQGSTHFTCTTVQSDGKIVVGGNTWNGSNSDFLVARYNVNGTLDSTFSDDGWQTTDLSVFAESVNSIVIQSDGKIVAGGNTSDQSGIRFALVRYNSNGSLDSTFSDNGIQISNLNSSGQINSLALQADGKIVAAGNVWNGSNNDVAVARYNTNGHPDSTFSSNGLQQTDLGNSEEFGNSVAVQSDGKIIVAGSVNNYGNADFVVLRYNADGSPDLSFNSNGILQSDIGGNDNCTAVALQADGKIVVAGTTSQYQDNDYQNTNMVAARFKADGTSDNTFGTNGIVITDLDNNDVATALAIEKNGKIILAGGSNSRFAFVRYTPDGALDSTFSQNRISTVSSKGSNAIENTVQGIAISNSRLYAAGDGKYPGNLGVMVKYQLDAGLKKRIVSITAPTKNEIFAAPANIKINAKATDPDGTIAKVEFFNDTTLLHTEFESPYGFMWKNVPTGNYSFTARATDNSGMVTTSSPVKVSVVPHKAPTVAITNPANYETFAGPATINLVAVAIDPESTIKKVKFYNGKTLLGIDSLYPYTYTWKDAPVGSYTLTAKAVNSFGLVTTSAAVNISVIPNIAPTVIITSIANGQSFTAPATIPLTASAKDPDGKISKVEFYSDTVLINTQYKSPYTYTWKDVPAGVYTITAKATDNLGLTKTSAPVKIIVTASDTPMVSNRPASVINLTGLNGDISLKAWPNPAGNIINIRTSGLPQNKPANISVISAMGGVMKTMQSNSSTQTTGLDVSSLVSGMYTVKVICADKVMYKQFIKL